MARPAPPFASLIISRRKLQLNCNQIKVIFYTSCRLNHGFADGVHAARRALSARSPDLLPDSVDILRIAAFSTG